MKRKCDFCGKNDAEILFKKIIGDEEITLFLCKECLNKGVLKLSDYELEDAEHSFVCPICKTTRKEFIEENFKIGCMQCLTAFSEDIDKILKVNGYYKGVGQSIEEDDIEKRIIIGKLKISLQKAVEEERYEEAAELKNKIEKMEK